MSPWELLGISPTGDTAAIKKAFAAKAKCCHPEEDPEGFVRLRQAFRQAMDQAEGRRPEAQPFSHPVILEEKKLPPALDFAHLQKSEHRGKPEDGETPQTNMAEELLAKPPEEAEIDFSSLSEAAAAQKTEARNEADKLLAQIAAAYQGKGKRQPAAWEGIFTGETFLRLRNSRYFTLHFLDYMMTHREFSPRVWESVFLPVVTDWHHLWYGTNLWVYFGLACGLEEDRKTRAAPVNNRLRRVVMGIGLAFCLLLIISVSKNRAEEQRLERQQNDALMRQIQSMSSAENIILNPNPDIALHLDLPFGHTLSEYLPLEKADYARLMEEEEKQAQIASAIEAASPYTEISAAAEDLEMSLQQYEELKNQYKAQTSAVWLKKELSRFTPVETHLVREKIWPQIVANIVSGAPAENSQYLCLSLGLEVEGYEKAAASYAESGRAALEDYLMAYSQFAFDAAVMQTTIGLLTPESASQSTASRPENLANAAKNSQTQGEFGTGDTAIP